MQRSPISNGVVDQASIIFEHMKNRFHNLIVFSLALGTAISTPGAAALESASKEAQTSELLQMYAAAYEAADTAEAKAAWNKNFSKFLQTHRAKFGNHSAIGIARYHVEVEPATHPVLHQAAARTVDASVLNMVVDSKMHPDSFQIALPKNTAVKPTLMVIHETLAPIAIISGGTATKEERTTAVLAPCDFGRLEKSEVVFLVNRPATDQCKFQWSYTTDSTSESKPPMPVECMNR